MTPKEILLDIARELAEHPEHWCQESWARNAQGTKVELSSPLAFSHCLSGHMIKRCCAVPEKDVSRALTTDLYGKTRALLEPHMKHYAAITLWNDQAGRTASDVIALCRKAAGEPT